MEAELPELLHEIIADILSRLPCKTLVKFRCVSKHWNSLICSQSFTNLHLTRSASDTSQIRVLLRPNPFYSIKYPDLDHFIEHGFDAILKDHTPPLLVHHLNNNETRLVGVCNGLVCFLFREIDGVVHESFLLWNPTTRECAEVDMSHMTVRTPEKILCDAYGFGYDLTAKGYKIVKLVVYDHPNAVVDVEIFSIASRTSRKLELPIFGFNHVVQMQRFLLIESCSFLNGACYWLMKKLPGSDVLILSVDVEKEEVELVTLFPPCLSESIFIGELRVCGGKLALAKTNSAHEMEIWMMDEYGMGSASFTKMLTLHKVPMLKFRSYARPICYLRNGGILVYDGKRFAIYDPEKITYKVSRGTSWRHNYIAMFAVTLISPYHISRTASVSNLRTM